MDEGGLIKKLKKFEGQGDFYDAIIPYTGGKDSTFILQYIRKNTDLKILAFTMDNWFISNETKENMKKIAKSIGIDHMIIKPNWEYTKKLYAEALIRFGEFCKVCEGLFAASLYKLTLKLDVPLIIWALNKSQFKTPPRPIRATDKKILLKNHKRFVAPLYEIAPSDRIKEYIFTFDYLQNLESVTSYPVEVFPFLVMEYQVDAIIRDIEKLGWKIPEDIWGLSSNCIAVNLFNYLKRYAFGKTEFKKMWDNIIQMEQSSYYKHKINKITFNDPDLSIIMSILCELNLSLQEIKDRMKIIVNLIR